MSPYLRLLLIAATLAIQSASSASSYFHECQHHLHHHRGWIQGHRLHSEEKLTIVVALKHPQAAKESLEAILDIELTERHLSLEELSSRMGLTPTGMTISNLTAWLKTAQVEPDFSQSGDFARLVLSRESAESLFPGASFFHFKHKHSRKRIVRSITTPRLPNSIVEHIDTVEGVCDFPRLRLKSNKKVKSRGGVVSTAGGRRGGDAPVLSIHRVTAGGGIMNVSACFNTTGNSQNISVIQVLDHINFELSYKSNNLNPEFKGAWRTKR